MSPPEKLDTNLDLTLDSTPIIEWLAQARKEGKLDRDGLRRSLIARLIWQSSYQHAHGLIENIAYLTRHDIWGEQPRATLAIDIQLLRKALSNHGYRLCYSAKRCKDGYYFQGRPLLDPVLEKKMIFSMREVDPEQMVLARKLSIQDRFAIGFAMIRSAERAGVYRLRSRNHNLSEEEALQMVRQAKVR